MSIDKNNLIIYIIIILFVISLLYICKKPNKYPNLDYNKERFQNIYEINDIIPISIINYYSKIAFVYYYSDNIYEYCQHSLNNLKAYCNKHNYGLVVYNKPFNNNTAHCWNKVAAIIKNLKFFDYLVWIDADAIIVNHNTTIEEIINIAPDKELFVCEDINKIKECINSGVLIIKNTQWTNELFLKIWNCDVIHSHNDQNVLLYIINKEIYPNIPSDLKFSKYCNQNMHPKVIVSDQTLFNTHIYNFKINNFILHLMGESSEARTHVMRQVNTLLKLDNYNSLDCVNYLSIEQKLDNKIELKNHIDNLNKKCLFKITIE